MVKELRNQFEGLLELLDNNKVLLSKSGIFNEFDAIGNFQSTIFYMNGELCYNFFDDSRLEYSKVLRLMDKDIEDIKLVEYENVAEFDEDEQLHFVLMMKNNNELHMVLENMEVENYV